MYGLTTLLTAVTPNPPSLGDIYNAGIIDTLIDVFKKCTEVFTVFPVNLFLIMAIIGMAVGLVKLAIGSWKASKR